MEKTEKKDIGKNSAGQNHLVFRYCFELNRRPNRDTLYTLEGIEPEIVEERCFDR
jgi:hypothetical protein